MGSLHRQLTNRSESFHGERNSLSLFPPRLVSLPPVMLFLSPRRPSFASHSSATSLRGPFPHFVRLRHSRARPGAYFLLFRDTFEKCAAANSLRIDNAKRISYQWGADSLQEKDENGFSRSTKKKKKKKKRARAVFLPETYRATIPFQFLGTGRI